MKKNFNIYYVEAFPISKLTDCGEEGWYKMPNHTRHQFRFLDAILEHVDNTFCEPIQIMMRSDGTVAAGPSGVTRLYAVRTLRKWKTIPAIVSAEVTPDWLDTSTPVTSAKQMQEYYRLEPADCGIEPDGQAYHRNHNPNPAQVRETFQVSESTKQRIITMLEEEAQR